MLPSCTVNVVEQTSGSTVATTGCDTLIQDQHHSTVESRPDLKREEKSWTKRPTLRYIDLHILHASILVVAVVCAGAEIIAQKQNIPGLINIIVTDTCIDAPTHLHMHTKVCEPALPQPSHYTWKPLVHYTSDF